MEDDRLDDVREALIGTAEDAERITRQRKAGARGSTDADVRVRAATPPRDLDNSAAPTDDEILRRSRATDPGVARIVLGGSLVLVGLMIVMTLYIVGRTGIDPLELIVLAILAFLAFGLINAITYKGDDPLEPMRRFDEERNANESARRARTARRHDAGGEDDRSAG